MRWSPVSVATHRRPIEPVFCGISGATRTTCMSLLGRALPERQAPTADREHDRPALARLGMAHELVVRGAEEARLVPALHAGVEDVLRAHAERARIERLARLVVPDHPEAARR